MSIKNIFLLSLFIALVSGFSCHSGEGNGNTSNSPTASDDKSGAQGGTIKDNDDPAVHSSGSKNHGNLSESSSGGSSLKGDEAPSPFSQNHHEEVSPDQSAGQKKLALLYVNANRGGEETLPLVALANSPKHPFGNTIWTKVQRDAKTFNESDLSQYDCSIIIARIPTDANNEENLCRTFNSKFNKLISPTTGILVLKPPRAIVEENIWENLHHVSINFITHLKSLSPNIMELSYYLGDIAWQRGWEDEQQQELKTLVEKICSAGKLPTV